VARWHRTPAVRLIPETVTADTNGRREKYANPPEIRRTLSRAVLLSTERSNLVRSIYPLELVALLTIGQTETKSAGLQFVPQLLQIKVFAEDK
jgi:hypothetical protein